MTLRGQVIRRFGIGLPFVIALLFLPAGSFRFWPGWCFLVLVCGSAFCFSLYLAKHDPELLERRMRVKEKESKQTLFKAFASLIVFSAMGLAALDFRLGWTRAWLGPVPLWGMLVGQAAVLAGMGLIIWVLSVNRFASRTIEVDPGQRVVSSGPYAIVRHPMYSGILLMMLAVAPALESYVALPVAVFVIPVLAFRLTDEERVLRRDLPGYAEYCQRTRFRLVPGVW